MVIPWNIYTPGARQGGEETVWVFIVLGWTWRHPTHRPMILKAKQKERKKEWGRKEKENKEGNEEYWFGDILLFAVSYHKSKPSFIDSNLTESQVLIWP